MSEVNETTTELNSKKHPPGLYLLFFTEMWERFSYYGMRGILVLYLTKSLIEGGLGISESNASLIYGIFTGFVYFTPLIGGWLADKYIGQRHSITIGGITMMLGQFALFSMNSFVGVWIGLILLVIGNGFFKPNISTLVGGLYKKGDPKRDSAFSIFYMGINVGAFLAPLAVGLLSNNIFATHNESGEILSYGYRYGFLAASIGMLIGQLLFNTLGNKYLGDLGIEPAGKIKSNCTDALTNSEPLSKEEKQRVASIFIFFFIAIFFWAGFEQAGSSFTLFTDKHVNRTLFGWTIPTEYFQSINPVFIVLLTPVFAGLWVSKLGQKMTTPIKMGIAMILLGLGFFFILAASAQVGSDPNSTIKASMILIVLTYFTHTLGELCLSPTGLSVVTKLAPPKLASLLMGVWLLSSCFANWLGGWIASIGSRMGVTDVYLIISVCAIAIGIVVLSLNKRILKLMNGVR